MGGELIPVIHMSKEYILQNFRNLEVWKKSHKLTLKVYESTSQFPREEIYGLTSQIRRACASIPTNIAEGSGRESAPDFARFLQIAVGSASETEYLIILAHELKYITGNAIYRVNGYNDSSQKNANYLTKDHQNPQPITHN